ncbi:MAG: hypothetical protein OXU45_08880 [Candidatus Melainabacteria bacterium]|nr:hypothetical protein [Candidatus Melainabacteria bacterium]
MSKRFMVIALAIALGFLNFSATEVEAKKKRKKLGFEIQDCTRIKGQPDIYICLKGEAGDGTLSQRKLNSVSSKTVTLIDRYKARAAKKKSGARKFLENDPCVIDPMSPECTGETESDPCAIDPMSPECTGETESDPCAIDPMSPECTGETESDPCAIDPMSPECTGETSDPCTIDPMSPECTGETESSDPCTVDPSSQACTDYMCTMDPSTCI